MITGARKYSLNRSSQVLPISEWASRIAPFAEAPARAKSASLPSPMSTKFASSPAAGVGGAHPTETSRIGNGAGIRTSSRVAPSLQLSGMVYFSARTSRSEEHTSELQSRGHLVCRLLLEKKKKNLTIPYRTQKPPQSPLHPPCP